MELQSIEQIKVEDLVKFTQSIIEFDNTDLKNQVQKVVDKFKGLIITEEMLPDIKKDRATLNGMAKKFDEIRIKIGKDYKAPLVEFEGKIKEICSILKNQVAALDDQTEGFEIKRKALKHEMIERLIQDVCIAKDLDEEKYISQLTIIDKYYNVTEKDYMIRKDLEQRADAILAQQKNDELQDRLYNSKIKFREILLANFNRENNMSELYSDYTIEKYPIDEDVKEMLKILLQTIPEKVEVVLVEKKSINMPTESTHDKQTIDYVDVRVYADEDRLMKILDENSLIYKIINNPKINKDEMPF